MSEAIEYVEIDISYCSLSYGVAPCEAELGVTGDAKCFNTKATCQDRDNFTPSTVTLRFARPAAHLPRDIEALPYIVSTEFSPATVSLGENIGQRASFKVTFSDHPHSDASPGFDKYHSGRGYNPYTRGQFWARFRARQPFLRQISLRWRMGFVGDALADMETRHFFVDSFEGPGPDGKFTITAKDALKFLDGDRAQAPPLSNGFLTSDISASAGSFTASPSGIGASYTGAGYICIGGKEVCAFTRSGDAFTLSARGARGTTAQEHKAQDRVQLCLAEDAVDPATIIRTWILSYTDLPSAYINWGEWLAETAAYLDRVYTFTITEPTPVAKLVSRICEQAGLAVWDDNVAQQLRLQVLRGVPTDVDRYSEANVINGTFSVKDQPDKRLSRVWFYFGLIDPTKRLDDPDNYRSTAEVVDDAGEENFDVPAIRKVFADGIPQFGRSIAEQAARKLLGRYRTAPRLFGFDLQRNSVTTPALGGGYRFEWWNLQDASGAREDVPIQVTRLTPSAVGFKLEAEEMRFVTIEEDDLDIRTITIDFSAYNLDLKAIHDGLYPPIESGQVVNFIFNAGTVVGSTSASTRALTVGTWPSGVTPNLTISGRIQGMGGAGGRGGDAGQPGAAGGSGGVALYTRTAINLTLVSGSGIWGGGGGGGGGGGSSGDGGFGGGGGGGGGAGQNPGAGGAPGTGSGSPTAGLSGTWDAAGAGGNRGGFAGTGGGNGGPGLNGGPGGASIDGAGIPGGSGGAAGAAIDGVSFVTFIAGGDIRGPQVN